MTQVIFHIIAEYVKKPHVAKNMHKASMKEHKGNKRKNLLAESKIGCNLLNCVPGRNETVYISKTIEVSSLGKLY